MGAVPPGEMVSFGLPPGLAAFGPPPGLEGQQVLEVDDGYIRDEPATIVSSRIAAECLSADAMCFEKGVPASVVPSMVCRHCAAMHDKNKLQSVEERLQCELAEASGLLLDMAQQFVETSKCSSDHSADHNVRRQKGPFMVGSEHIVEGIIKNPNMILEEVCNKLSQHADYFLHARELDDWERLAASSIDALAFVDTIGVGERTPRTLMRDVTRALQNVIMLTIALGISDDEFAQLDLQGLSAAVKKPLGYMLYQSYMIDTVEDFQFLLSRLGVAKYHIFNAGKKFSRRAKRIKMVRCALPANAEPGARLLRM